MLPFPAVALLLLLLVCLQEKIEAIAVGTYGAAGVSYSPEAEEAIQVRAREARRACACGLCRRSGGQLWCRQVRWGG